jgi:hypothetical protein
VREARAEALTARRSRAGVLADSTIKGNKPRIS